MVDLESPRQKVRGIIVPHAGYVYSGKTAGKVFSIIEPADSYIILGPNHHGLGGDFSIFPKGIWRTPIGDCKIDDLIAREIFLNSGEIEEDVQAHLREHSIEVQLPFLKYLSDDVNFVPISIKHYRPDLDFLNYCIKIGEIIAGVIQKTSMNVTVIASSDFTHYESIEDAKRKDSLAINAIKKLDSKQLFEVVGNERISMCGYAPIAVTLEICKNLGSNSAELIDYTTSAEVSGDETQVVGYAGFKIV